MAVSVVLLMSNISMLVAHTALVNQYNDVIDVMSNQYRLNQSVADLINNYNDLVRGNNDNVSASDPKIAAVEQRITATIALLNKQVVDPTAKASFVGLENSIRDVMKEVNTGVDDFAHSKGTSVEHYQSANRIYNFVQTNATTFTFDQLQYVNSVEKKLHTNYRNFEISAIAFLLALTAGSLLYGVRFAQKIVSPLKQLSQVAEDIAADKADVVIPAQLLAIHDETGSLSNSFNVMFSRLKEKIAELNAAKTSVEKKVEERTVQLHAEQAKLLASIQSLPSAFALADANGDILIQNDRVQEVFHLQDQPKSIKQFDAPSQDFDWAESFDRVLQTKQAHPATELTVDANTIRLFMGPVTVRESDNEQVIGAVILAEDITEAKILDRSKDEFFSIASHELRTPLTAIKGNSSMILNYFADELKNIELKDMVREIHNSSTRLIEIVNDFLDLSRLEQGKMVFTTQEFILGTVLESVVSEMQTVLKAKNLYLHLDADAFGKLPQVRADPNRTKQVVYNLIGNAVKFTEKGGITISVRQKASFLKVEVTDTGRGMSPQSQTLLFHKFQQTGDSLLTRDTTKGTGLGLYISKQMIEKMGGEIKLERSEAGKGTTFSFTLPIANISK